MKQKSWHLDRRTFLRSAGVCIALPWLEAMSIGKTPERPPKRFFAGYFANGVPMPEDTDEDRIKNGWFPMGTGANYQVTDMHKGMLPLKEKFTFLSGMHHENGPTHGHQACGSFLTGIDSRQALENKAISLDQYLAERIGDETRYKSLVYSTQGGVNFPKRTTTLSFNREGRSIPALNDPKEIFRRLFGSITQSEKSALDNRGSIIDLVLSDAKDIGRRLGKDDNDRMDEYLSSVREVERLTEREISWLKTPKPEVDDRGLNIETTPNEPKEYLKTMYDLMALALQTDSSRFITYQATSEAETDTYQFPLGCGITTGAHALSHKKRGEYDEPAKYLTFLNDMYYDFLKKLDSIQEGDSTLLDNTICIYGSTTSWVHRAVNYPMTLCGGKNIGFKHGAHYNSSEPFANVLMTIANQMGVPTEQIVDSTSDIGALL